jgi:hypothetical protein
MLYLAAELVATVIAQGDDSIGLRRHSKERYGADLILILSQPPVQSAAIFGTDWKVVYIR